MPSDYAKGLIDEVLNPDVPSHVPENEVVNPASVRERAKLAEEAKGLFARTKQAQKVRGLIPKEPPALDSEADAKEEYRNPLMTPSDEVTPESRHIDNQYILKHRTPLLESIANAEQENPHFRNPLTPEINAVTAPGPKASWDESVVDFLFGGEMAIIGMQYDNGVITHDWEIAKQQWSEEPLWVNALNMISLGSYAFPLARGAFLSAKFGKLGGILGKTAQVGEDLARYKALGLVEEGATHLSDKARDTLRIIEDSRAGYLDYQSKLDMIANGETSANISKSEQFLMSVKQGIGNSYMDIVGPAARGDETGRTLFNKNLNELFSREDFGHLFKNMPDFAPDDTRMYEHFLSKMGVQGARSRLNKAELQWADGLEAAMKSHTEEAVREGMITTDTVAKVGEMHIPAQFKGTPSPEISTGRKYFLPSTRKATAKEIEAGVASKGDKITVLEAFDFPRLDSPTLRTRKKELPEVFRRLQSGELISDPYSMTTRGYMMDRLLLNNFKVVTGMATDSKWAIRGDDAITKFGSLANAEKAGWVSLDRLTGEIPNTLRRMIKKKDVSFLGSGDELPLMKKAAFEDLFGESGIFAQSQMATNILEASVSLHKTAKTGYSIPTHLQNILSNAVLLMQRGFNMFSKENLRIQKESFRAFRKINEHIKMKKLEGPYSLRKAAQDGSLKLNLGPMKVGNKTLNLADELTDPRVLDLVEESSYEMAEGHARMERMIDNLREDQKVSRALLKGYQKIENFGNKKFGNIFSKMSELYLAEDMVPKLSYYLSLRGEGLTREAAIIEVGRALPMYATVGTTVKKARKWVFPWASFPVEAARVTKNNIMDHPLRTLPWLHATSELQALMAVTGQGPATRAEAKADMRNLPLWAQKSETVLASQGAVESVGMPLAGAAVGGGIGLLAGGATGLAAGAAIGGAAGAAKAVFAPSKDADHMRGIMMNWLPHSPWMLQNISPEATGDILPFQNWEQAMEQSPIGAPGSIGLDMLHIFQGKNSYGQELKSEGMVDKGMQVFAGLVGFISPPMLQKYAFQPGKTPDISIMEQALGGDSPAARQLDPTNIARLGIDSGLMIDPVTGKPGSLSFDLFMNNFGAIKSYSTDPSNRLFNESLNEQKWTEIRGYATKNLSAFLENGMEDEAVGRLRLVQSTFSKQYPDSPQMAQRKYTEWLKRYGKTIGMHPRLKGWSKEELNNRLDELSRFSEEMRGRVRSDTMDLIKAQLELKGGGSSGTLKSTALGSQGILNSGIKSGGF